MSQSTTATMDSTSHPQSRAGIIAAAVVLVAVVGMWAVTGAGNLKAQHQREADAAEKAAVAKSLGQAQAGQPWSAVAEDAGAESYVVSGAGSRDFDGVYKAAGSYNHRPVYVHGKGAAARYLSYNMTGPRWALGTAPGGVSGGYIGSAGSIPTGPWSAVGGTFPAPTVRAK